MFHEILHSLGLCPENFNVELFRHIGNLIHILLNTKVWKN